jgi:hypothetical protein
MDNFKAQIEARTANVLQPLDINGVNAFRLRLWQTSKPNYLSIQRSDLGRDVKMLIVLLPSPLSGPPLLPVVRSAQ